MELAPADSEELRAAWQAAAAEGTLKDEKERRSYDGFPEQFLLLVTCRDEQHQVELLQRFHDEGIQVKALLSERDYRSVPDTVVLSPGLFREARCNRSCGWVRLPFGVVVQAPGSV